MSNTKPDFDTAEMQEAAERILESLGNEFTTYERSRGPNFTASLAGTIVARIFAQLLLTAPNIESQFLTVEMVMNTVGKYMKEEVATEEMLAAIKKMMRQPQAKGQQ